MKTANREKIPVIPRGAGTNICGGSVAKQGGIVMAFHRLNRILEIDPENRCADGPARRGERRSAEGRRRLRADVSSRPGQHVRFHPGGNVALNAGGPGG